MECNLKFNFNLIENLSNDSPKFVYRYFSNASDRENFLSGNIWFCSPNQNRYVHSVVDKWEYRNAISEFMYEYSLSFSSEILDENKPNIKIEIKGFLEEIRSSIVNTTSTHKISWLSKKELEKFINFQHIEIFPDSPDDTVFLYLMGYGARKVDYTTKITTSSCNRNNYSCNFIAQNARAQNDDFKDENEIRIFLTSGDFLKNYNGKNLSEMVEYIKLFCPNIRKYCVAL